MNAPDRVSGAGLCPRCGRETALVHVLGHDRQRCSAPECDALRRHRRDQQAESARRLALGPEQAPPSRPSVEDMQRFYEEGAGFHAAVREAERLLAAGVADDLLLEEIGVPPLSRRILNEAKRRLASPTDARVGLRVIARKLSRRPDNEQAA